MLTFTVFNNNIRKIHTTGNLLKLASVCFVSLKVSHSVIFIHMSDCVIFHIYRSSYFFVCSLNCICVWWGGILPCFLPLPLTITRFSFSVMCVFANELTSFYVCHESTFLYAYVSGIFLSGETHCLLLSFSDSLPFNPFFIFSCPCHFVSPFSIPFCSFCTLWLGIFSATII